MTSLELRLPLGLGNKLIDTVRRPGPREHVAFCLVSMASAGERRLLLARDVVTLPEHAYVEDETVGAAWRGVEMLPIIEAARADGLGIILVHSHLGGVPSLSRADSESARRLLPLFNHRIPGATHGSIVLAGSRAGGLISEGGEEPRDAQLRVRQCGEALIDWDPTHGELDADTRDALDGGQLSGQRRLGRWTVAVVGLSGGGGHVVQQLARLGVGTIIGIDDDRAEDRNGHKIVGLKPNHLAQRWRKVDIMAEMVAETCSGSLFVGVPHRVPSPEALEALKTADVMVGCLDNLHARADLQEIAWRFVIPYVDIGVNIRVSESGKGIAAGNVLTLRPGGFCMWCAGFLSKHKLDEELAGVPNRSYFQNRPGEAQVISFNGTVASQAVSEILQLLTGFSGRSLDPADLLADVELCLQRGFKKFDGNRGELREWGARRRATCPRCAGDLGRGTVVWSRLGIA